MIKKTSLLDIKDLYKLEKSCFLENHWSLEQIELHHIDQESILYWHEGDAVAYLIFNQSDLEIEILRIGVLQEYRNMSIATELLLYLMHIKGNKEIFLEVNVNNQAAVGLYTKMNFKKVGERKNYYSDGSSAFIMLLAKDV